MRLYSIKLNAWIDPRELRRRPFYHEKEKIELTPTAKYIVNPMVPK
jgi:hypothetical protein